MGKIKKTKRRELDFDDLLRIKPWEVNVSTKVRKDVFTATDSLEFIGEINDGVYMDIEDACDDSLPIKIEELHEL